MRANGAMTGGYREPRKNKFKVYSQFCQAMDALKVAKAENENVTKDVLNILFQSVLHGTMVCQQQTLLDIRSRPITHLLSQKTRLLLILLSETTLPPQN